MALPISGSAPSSSARPYDQERNIEAMTARLKSSTDAKAALNGMTPEQATAHVKDLAGQGRISEGVMTQALGAIGSCTSAAAPPAAKAEVAAPKAEISAETQADARSAASGRERGVMASLFYGIGDLAGELKNKSGASAILDPIGNTLGKGASMIPGDPLHELGNMTATGVKKGDEGIAKGAELVGEGYDAVKAGLGSVVDAGKKGYYGIGNVAGDVSEATGANKVFDPIGNAAGAAYKTVTGGVSRGLKKEAAPAAEVPAKTEAPRIAEGTAAPAKEKPLSVEEFDKMLSKMSAKQIKAMLK